MRDAVAWWEPKRVLFNFTLAAIVVFVFWMAAPQSLERINAMRCARAVILAGLANLAYCAAYLLDIIVFQHLEGRNGWRTMLFVAGLLFAAAVTFVISVGATGAIQF